MTQGTSLGACEGDRYHDLCSDKATCGTCSIWQLPDETATEWKARIREMWNAPDARPAYGVPRITLPNCPQGHPWAENERTYSGGKRYCRQCSIDLNRAYRRRQRERRQEAVA